MGYVDAKVPASQSLGCDKLAFYANAPHTRMCKPMWAAGGGEV